MLTLILIVLFLIFIIYPQILNIFNDVKDTGRSLFKKNINEIVNLVEKKFMAEQLSNDIEELIFEYENYKLKNNISLEYKGRSPKSGIIIIKGPGDVSFALSNGNLCAKKEFKSSEIKITTETDCKLEFTQ